MAKRKLSLLEQAAKARRLAASIPDDEVAKKLLKLAEEYEALAKSDEPEDDEPNSLH
jgi:hypothetical protein